MGDHDGEHRSKTTTSAPESPWRRGTTPVLHGDLADHLVHVARHHARQAIASWTACADDGQDADCVGLDGTIHAGAAVELISKAAIWHREPLLLGVTSTRPQQQNLLDIFCQLRGVSHYAPGAKPQRLETINAATAIQFVGRIYPATRPYAEGAKKVANARNDAIHLGFGGAPEDLSVTISEMTAYVESVVESIGENVLTFWGDEKTAKAATRASSERDALVGNIARHRIAAAKGQHALEWKYLAHRFRTGRLAQKPPESDVLAEETCPACAKRAWLMWTAEGDVDYDADGSYSFYGGWSCEFKCLVCGLELDEEEARAVGIDTHYEPAPEDVEYHIDSNEE